MNSQRLMVQFVLTFYLPPFLLLCFYYKESYVKKIDRYLVIGRLPYKSTEFDKESKKAPDIFRGLFAILKDLL